MKKIVVLTLFPLLLSATSCSLLNKKSTSGDESEDGPTSSDPYHNEPARASEVSKGQEHALPWTISYDTFSEDAGALSYESFHKTYNVDSTNVYCYGMRAVTDISVNINGSLVPYGGFKIIHFCKVGHEKFPDGGQIQISDLQPQKLTVEIVSNNRYTYSSMTAPTVYVGNTKFSGPKDYIKTVSPIHEEFNVFTITYELNATQAGVIKIKNEQSFSMYLQSLQFE